MPPPSPDPLAAVEAAYHQHYESAPVRAAVSFVGVEQILVLRYEWRECRDQPVAYSYLSLGMSRYPMADPAAPVVQSRAAPRAELLISTLGRVDDVWRRLAVLAAGPAVEAAVYRIGTRIDLGEPWCSGSRCAGALVVESTLRPVSVPGLAEIAVLQLLPASPTELAWARVHGSDALIQRWQRDRVELRDLLRIRSIFGNGTGGFRPWRSGIGDQRHANRGCWHR